MSANRFGPGLPFVDQAGRLTPAASNALNAVIDRTGGATGDVTTTDVSAYPVAVIASPTADSAPVSVDGGPINDARPV